jgi:hypothetical protein
MWVIFLPKSHQNFSACSVLNKLLDPHLLRYLVRGRPASEPWMCEGTLLVFCLEPRQSQLQVWFCEAPLRFSAHALFPHLNLHALYPLQGLACALVICWSTDVFAGPRAKTVDPERVPVLWCSWRWALFTVVILHKYTVKPAWAVNSIKQPPAVSSHLL